MTGLVGWRLSVSGSSLGDDFRRSVLLKFEGEGECRDEFCVSCGVFGGRVGAGCGGEEGG